MGTFPDCDVKLCDLEISRVIVAGQEVRELLGTPDYVCKFGILRVEKCAFLIFLANFSFLASSRDSSLRAHNPVGGYMVSFKTHFLLLLFIPL